MDSMLENIEVVKQAAASGNPEAQAVIHRLQRWARTDSDLIAAKAALVEAEKLHAGRVTDLRLAMVSAEEIAAPRIAAVAKANDALSKAEADHAATVATLREAVAKAQAAADAARVK